MKYRLEGTTIENIDTFVRITLGNGMVEVSKRECPSGAEVASMLQRMQEYSPNRAQLSACARVAGDAKDCKVELAL